MRKRSACNISLGLDRMAFAAGIVRIVLFCTLWNFRLIFGQSRSNIVVPIGLMLNDSSVVTQVAVEYEISQLDQHPDRGSVGLQSVGKRFIDMTDSLTTDTEFCRLIKEGVFAVFGNPSSESIHSVQAHGSALEMPVISTGLAVNNSGQDQGYVLFMKPYYVPAVVDVIRHYGWTEVWYMFNSNDGLTRLQQLLDTFSKSDRRVSVKILRVQDGASGLDAMATIDNYEGQQVILDLSLKECEVFLNGLTSRGFSNRHHFFIMELGVDSIDTSLYNGGMNVTGFRMFDDKQQSGFEAAGGKITNEAALAIDGIRIVQQTLEQLNRSDPDVFDNTLKSGKAVNKGSVNADCYAKVITPWQLGYELITAMKRASIEDGISGRLSFDEYGLRKDYDLQLLEVTTRTALSFTGTWNDVSGLQLQVPEVIREQENLQDNRKTKLVTSILEPPYLMLRENHVLFEGNDRYEGYCADIIKLIERRLDLDLQIELVKDGRYGSMDESGTWDGMVGELIRREAHLAIASLTITYSREQYVEFSMPFMSLGIGLLMKKPGVWRPSMFMFLNVFSFEIWILIVIAYIGTSICLYVVSALGVTMWCTKRTFCNTGDKNDFTFLNSLWNTMASLLRQRSSPQPKSLSGRVVASFWYMFGVVMTACYIAQLILFYSVGPLIPQIGSASDLAQQTEIKYGMVKGGSTADFFQRSTIFTYERMWHSMSNDPTAFITNTQEGIARVRSGRYAFFAESTLIEYVSNQVPCDTMQVGGLLNSRSYGIAMPLGSDLRARIDLSLLEMREDGTLQKLYRKWWIDREQCGKAPEPKDDNGGALQLRDLAGVFIILLFCLGLALLTAVIEYFVNKDTALKKQIRTQISSLGDKSNIELEAKQ